MKDVFNFKFYKSQEQRTLVGFDEESSHVDLKEGDTGTVKFSSNGQQIATFDCKTILTQYGGPTPILLITNKEVDMEGIDPENPDWSKYPKFGIIFDRYWMLSMIDVSSGGGPENELVIAITNLLEPLVNDDDYITVVAEVTYNEGAKPTMKLPINDDDKLLYLLECKVNDATPDELVAAYPNAKESLAKIAFGREAMADIPFHQYPDVTESLSKILELDITVTRS